MFRFAASASFALVFAAFASAFFFFPSATLRGSIHAARLSSTDVSPRVSLASFAARMRRTVSSYPGGAAERGRAGVGGGGGGCPPFAFLGSHGGGPDHRPVAAFETESTRGASAAFEFGARRSDASDAFGSDAFGSVSARGRTLGGLLILGLNVHSASSAASRCSLVGYFSDADAYARVDVAFADFERYPRVIFGLNVHSFASSASFATRRSAIARSVNARLRASRSATASLGARRIGLGGGRYTDPGKDDGECGDGAFSAGEFDASSARSKPSRRAARFRGFPGAESENASSPHASSPHASSPHASSPSGVRRRFRSRPIGVRDNFTFAAAVPATDANVSASDASRSAEYPAGHHGVFDSRARRPTSNSRPRSDPPLDRSNANVASRLFAIAHTRSVSARETAPANLAKSHAGTARTSPSPSPRHAHNRYTANASSRIAPRVDGGAAANTPASRSAGPNASLSRYEPSRTARRSTARIVATRAARANLSASAAASFGARRAISRASSRRSASLRASRVAASACIARATRLRSVSVRIVRRRDGIFASARDVIFASARDVLFASARSVRLVDSSRRRACHGRRSADATRSRSATARGVDDNAGRNPPFVSSAAFASRARSSRNSRSTRSCSHRAIFAASASGSTRAYPKPPNDSSASSLAKSRRISRRVSRPTTMAVARASRVCAGDRTIPREYALSAGSNVHAASSSAIRFAFARDDASSRWNLRASASS